MVELKPDLSTEENREYWTFIRRVKEEFSSMKQGKIDDSRKIGFDGGFVRVIFSKDPVDDILKLELVEFPEGGPTRIARASMDPGNVADLVAVLSKWLDEEI
jgi:hypothetical protein